VAGAAPDVYMVDEHAEQGAHRPHAPCERWQTASNTVLASLRVGARCGVYDRNNDFGAYAPTPWPGRPAASTMQELRLLASSGGMTPAGSGLARARGRACSTSQALY